MSLLLMEQFEDAEMDNSISLTNGVNDVEVNAGLQVLQPQRLSKLVQRLLNPSLRKNDYDVIIESPEIIPLNDQFIQDFGRRERNYDQALGIAPIEINRDISDDENDNIVDCQSNEEQPSAAAAPVSRKVKITNIKYTTTAETMQTLLEKEFGPVESLNLIMKKERAKDNNSQPLLNSGLAYVTFLESSSAGQCLDNLKSMDQRPVTVSLVSASASASKSGPSLHGAGRRYWSEIDLSIQCHRCGQMGHMSYECMQTANAASAVDGTSAKVINSRRRKPCPLCANTVDHSEMYQCPFRVVCFNCGIPGHISRDCSKRKNSYQKQPVERSFCTLCYASNHHTKSSCPWSTRNSKGQVHPRTSSISINAICASCGRSGHYLCSDLKWFFGLRGVSCSNCGLPDHIGSRCIRPNLEVCSRNEELLMTEIDRAGTVRSVESSLMEANSNQNDSSQRNRERHRNSRHRNDDDNSTGGRYRHSNNTTKSDRGRQLNREDLPHFRPFKSMPPRSYPKNQSRESQSHKRHHRDNDDSTMSPAKSKRARYN